MSRQEFPRAVKVAVVKRATRDRVVFCEKCGAPTTKWQIDHVIADSHGGKPVIENAELICEVCYGVKNPIDTKIAAKIKRQEAKDLRVPSNGRPGPRSLKAGPKDRTYKDPFEGLRRRSVYED
jgi:5-methylcytosine-specific restriction endonuclease McrA